ncbi:MAG: hypothetical protein QOG70_287 [Solirubrobacteraceae bacterium]|jgi:hypothetical protein|nr:hypothetical protein [Solirubrobacteraceae bacterium]
MAIIVRLAGEGIQHHGVLLTWDVAMPRSRNTVGVYVRALDDYLRAHPTVDALPDRVDWLHPRT